MRTYKVMIHPNNKQATKIRKTLNKCIECQNIVYDYLDSFIKSKTKLPSCSDVRKWFTKEKKLKDQETINKRINMTKKEMIANHLDTLFYDISNDALKQMVKDTYNSFVRFFKKLSKYPNRKSYKDKHKSFYVDPYKIGFTDKKVRLEKIANNQKSNRQVLNWVNMAERNRIPLKVKYYNPRVVYDGYNFYIVVGVEETITNRIKSDDRVIGIDLNNAEIVTSENKRYNQVTKSKKYKKILKRKKRLQRSLSRKYLVSNPENKKRVQLSKNYRKNKSLVIKLDKRLRNLRDNNHNEIITDILSKPPKIIVLEDIHVKEMSNKESRMDKDYKEKQASKYITEASYRKFRLLLENRVNKYETTIVIANQYYASSKTCSVCGNKQEMKVDKRTYKCEKCGLILDRDLNAAINLANFININ